MSNTQYPHQLGGADLGTSERGPIMISARGVYLKPSEDDANNLSDEMYEIPGPQSANNQSFIIVRRPERLFNVSRDNFMAQRDLRKAGVDIRDWYHESIRQK